MKFTKNQITNAFIKYYENINSNPEEFLDVDETTHSKEEAIDSANYLISLID